MRSQDDTEPGPAMIEVGRALSCEVRLMMLVALADGGATVSELVKHTGTTQPNVSNHLAVLRSAGLVSCRRTGRSAEYELASPRINDLVKALVAASHPPR